MSLMRIILERMEITEVLNVDFFFRGFPLPLVHRYIMCPHSLHPCCESMIPSRSLSPHIVTPFPCRFLQSLSPVTIA